MKEPCILEFVAGLRVSGEVSSGTVKNVPATDAVPCKIDELATTKDRDKAALPIVDGVISISNPLTTMGVFAPVITPDNSSSKSQRTADSMPLKSGTETLT